MKTTTENAKKTFFGIFIGEHSNTRGEPPNVAPGNRLPGATLYDFLTLPVRTPQAQLGWGKTFITLQNRSKRDIERDFASKIRFGYIMVGIQHQDP